jgi:superfamily II DNA/RNA helicase
VLAPTMELAAQTSEVVKTMGKFMKGLKIISALKGSQVQRNVELDGQVIIGTPGTTLDWSSPRVNCFQLKKLKVFVLDEADVMIDQQGHQDTCIRIVR